MLYKEKSFKSEPRSKWWYSGGWRGGGEGGRSSVGVVGWAEGRERNPGGNGVFAVGEKENPGGSGGFPKEREANPGENSG